MVVGVDPHRVKGFQVFGLGDGGRYKAGGLVGGGFPVMHPADLLANVGVFVEIRVHPGPFDGPAKGQFVQAGSTGGHHHPVDLAVFDVFLDKLLAGIGAHEHVGVGDGYPIDGFNVLGELGYIDMVGNIAPAVADVDTDILFFRIFFRTIGMHSLSPGYTHLKA